MIFVAPQSMPAKKDHRSYIISFFDSIDSINGLHDPFSVIFPDLTRSQITSIDLGI